MNLFKGSVIFHLRNHTLYTVVEYESYFTSSYMSDFAYIEAPKIQISAQMEAKLEISPLSK